MKPICQADDTDAAKDALSAFENGAWGRLFPTVTESWQRHWDRVIPFFAFAAPVRVILYTTNAMKGLRSSVRKAIRNKGDSPSDEAATKLIWLVLRHITAMRKNPAIA